MTDEDLRARLARLDPLRADAAALRGGPTGHEIRERVMQTIDEASPTSAPPARRLGRRPLIVGAAAASVVGIALGAVLLGGGDGRTAKRSDPTTLALQLPPGNVMQSCVVFDVAILADMPVAFGGTVVDVGADKVTLDVDRWYKGGDADQVTVATPPDTSSASLDGVEFVQGGRFLVTATEGTVNGCGFSGPATPDLEKAFAEAFGG